MAVHKNLVCENFVEVSAIFMSAAKSTGTILVFDPERLAQDDSLVARFGSVDPMSHQGVFVDEFPLAPGALWGQGPFDMKLEGVFINWVVRIVLHVVGPLASVQGFILYGFLHIFQSFDMAFSLRASAHWLGCWTVLK